MNCIRNVRTMEFGERNNLEDRENVSFVSTFRSYIKNNNIHTFLSYPFEDKIEPKSTNYAVYICKKIVIFINHGEKKNVRKFRIFRNSTFPIPIRDKYRANLSK